MSGSNSRANSHFGFMTKIITIIRLALEASALAACDSNLNDVAFPRGLHNPDATSGANLLISNLESDGTYLYGGG